MRVIKNRPKLGIILVLMGLIFGLRSDGSERVGEATKPELTQTSLKNCWEQFKHAHCDIDNPIGSLCQSLYQCYINEASKRHSIPRAEPEGDEELEETDLGTWLMLLFIGVSLCYFLGFELAYKLSVCLRHTIRAWQRCLSDDDPHLDL